MNLILNFFTFITVSSGLVFIYYGLFCLLSEGMQEEFERFKLSRFRKLVGLLELLGGIGSFVGLIYNPILILSSAGLIVLMLLGTFTRVKVKDSLILQLPAIFLMIINTYIFYIALQIG